MKLPMICMTTVFGVPMDILTLRMQENQTPQVQNQQNKLYIENAMRRFLCILRKLLWEVKLPGLLGILEFIEYLWYDKLKEVVV